MRNSLSVAIVTLLATMPAAALAQPPRPAPLEVGVQVSKEIDDPAAHAKKMIDVTLNWR